MLRPLGITGRSQPIRINRRLFILTFCRTNLFLLPSEFARLLSAGANARLRIVSKCLPFGITKKCFTFAAVVEAS